MKDGSGTIRKKVFVGMSGGVDSSVAALLLRDAGYDITGVFIKVWSPDWLPCTWREDRRSAMRAAAHLGIPLLTLDFSEEYKREVVDYMLAEYRAGRTPNPDVMCNKHIKFGSFLREAFRRGADYIATGHYARTCGEGLCVSKDLAKDQTYFLWTLGPKELSRTLFPIGGYEKRAVREIARKAGLPNADRKDSQGLCFIGAVDMKEFLTHYIETKPGDVLNESADHIGAHEGAVLYTIGERHGFSVPAASSHGAPLYVVAKDREANTITVSAAPRAARPIREVRIAHANWTSGFAPAAGPYAARVRYRQPLQMCRLVGNMVIFNDPQTIAPGQSLVLYNGERCLGGGILA